MAEIITDTTITGVFIKNIYTSEDKSYCVSVYRDSDTDKQFIAVGSQLPSKKDLPVTFVGTWGINKKTNRKQFMVGYTEAAKPTGQKEIVAYFGSLKCGIGKLKAMQIYRKFGSQTWDILDQCPERLKEVSGIAGKTFEKLIKAVAESNVSREVLKLFTKAGVTISGDALDKLIKNYGADTVQEITDNPFIAYGLDGFTFDKCDALAASLNMPLDAPARLRAYVRKVLYDATFSGHVCLPKDELLSEMVKGSGVSKEKCVEAINSAYTVKDIRSANGHIYLPELYDHEASICENIVRLSQCPIQRAPYNLDSIISEYETSFHLILADSQKDAIKMVFQNPVSIITGGPGTGKTTVTKAVLYAHELIFKNNSTPLLLAPTGKAARRMSEATGYPAATIHSAVGWRGDDVEIPMDEDRVLNGNLILIDESSMVDQNIASILLNLIEDGSRVVFIGDIDQLPSVGCGNVLHDLIASQVVPTTRLNVIFRQAGTNPIVANAHAINTGNTKMIETRTFRFIETSSDGETFLEACKLYIRCVKAYGIDNVILLNPQRNNTDLSVENFNKKLQELLNPHIDGGIEITIGKTVFRAGDRIMELKNTADAKNGDVGIIIEMNRRPDPDDPSEWQYYAVVEFNGDGNYMEYNTDDLRHVTHAWCTTVHKSQGAEYKTVIQIISKAHPSMLKRKLVYTGITRAKENVAIIGERDAFCMAVENNHQEARYTLLAQRLNTALRGITHA